MKRRRAHAQWIVAALMALAAPLAVGQTMYRCSTGSGTFVTDKPCATTTAAQAPAPAVERPKSAAATAQSIVPFLSPQCAQLNEAVRTGASRGLKREAINELLTNYRQRCAEEEQQAYLKIVQARVDDRTERRQAQAAQNAEQTRVQISREQCAEMLRILTGKRSRVATMSEGERGDFERFEANYQARCKS